MYKLLIVDDEPLVRICLKSYLDWETLGFTIVGEAADGMTALQMIGDLRPDLVLLDIKMPKMDGLEVLDKLQTGFPEIMVIMLSSFNDFLTVREAFKRNAFDYIHKPTMTEESLREMICLASGAIKRQDGKKNDTRERNATLRQQVLRELLASDELTENDIRFMFAEYGVLLKSKGAAVLHFQLKNYDLIKSRYTGDTTQRLNMVVFNLIQETMRSIREWEYLLWEENHHVLILGIESNEKGENEIRHLGDRIKENMSQFLNADVLMGCSGIYTPMKLRTCFQEGQMALNYNLLTRNSNRLFYKEMRAVGIEDLEAEGHVTRALQYINRHYTEQLSLDTVAQVVGLNKSYLSRIFKAKTGENMSNYINQCRIHRAAELLRKTDSKAYEIAYMVGYNNVEYFNQVFKRIMGVSPREYR